MTKPLASDIANIQVKLVKDDKKVKAVPIDPSQMTSANIFVEPASFKKQKARLGEIWQASLRPSANGILLATLTDKLSEKFIQDIPGHWINPETLFNVQAWLEASEHVCFNGLPGCGKTSLMERLSKARGWIYVQVDCGTKKAVTDWFGADAAEQGKTFHIKSRFADKLAEAKDHPDKTYAIGFDELNRVHGILHNSLMSLLSDQRQVEITTIDGTVIIEAPTNVIFLATRNDERKSTGAHVLDYAMRNRFQMVEIEFMPEEKEISFLMNETKVTETDARLIVQVANEIRRSIKGNAYIAPMPSPRDTRRAAILASHNKGARYACEHTFLAGLDGSVNQATTQKGKVAESINKIMPAATKTP